MLLLAARQIAATLVGDAHTAIRTPRSRHTRPIFGSARTATALNFVSQAALAADLGTRLRLHKPLVAVRGCRSVKKADMIHNAYTPRMQVDAQTYEVRADGALLTCEPATVLPRWRSGIFCFERGRTCAFDCGLNCS